MHESLCQLQPSIEHLRIQTFRLAKFADGGIEITFFSIGKTQKVVPVRVCRVERNCLLVFSNRLVILTLIINHKPQIKTHRCIVRFDAKRFLEFLLRGGEFLKATKG